MPTTEQLAARYVRTKGTRPSREEYSAFVNWVSMRFNRIRHMVDFTEQEVSPRKMQIHADLWGRILVSTAHNTHPHWLPFINAQFRAIHDADHLEHNLGFDLDGEVCAFVAASESAPESIRWILYSEIVLQAAAAIHTGSFARQKLVR
jgi:hypothetical protein